MNQPDESGKAMLKVLCAAYQLGDLTGFQKVGGTRNVNFVLKTTRGQWFARKRYRGYSDPDRIRFDHEATAFLARNGVPVTAPLRNKESNTWWCHDGDAWEVFDFVEGRHLRDGTVEDGSTLAVALAGFHRAGAAFTGRYDKIGPRGETDPENLLATIATLRKEAPDTAPALQTHEAAVGRAAEMLDSHSFLDLPHTLVHGDVQPGNILINADRVRAFVDLDWCAWRPRLYDLGFAMLTCCAKHDTPIGTGDIWKLTQAPQWNVAIVGEFLTAYASESSPLSVAERKALVPQLVLTWCHSRLHGALKVPANQRRAFLERGPEIDSRLFHELTTFL